MNLQGKLRAFARWGRRVFIPIGRLDRHLRSLVHQTGKELRFHPVVIERLEIEAEATLQECGIKK